MSKLVSSQGERTEPCKDSDLVLYNESLHLGEDRMGV